MCAISEKHLASWTKTIQEWVIILNRYNSEPKHQNNRWTSKWKSIRICMRSVVFCQRIDILYSSHIQILGPEGAFSLQVMGNFDYIWLMQLFVTPNLRQTVVVTESVSSKIEATLVAWFCKKIGPVWHDCGSELQILF